MTRKGKFKTAYLTGSRGAKHPVRVSQWFRPYDKGGKTNFSQFTAAKAGLYLVKSTRGKIQYVGFSRTQLQKTIYRHFQSWNDPTQQRVTFDKAGFRIRLVLGSIAQIEALEKVLIRKLNPSKQIQMYPDFPISDMAAPSSLTNTDDDFEFPF